MISSLSWLRIRTNNWEFISNYINLLGLGFKIVHKKWNSSDTIIQGSNHILTTWFWPWNSTWKWIWRRNDWILRILKNSPNSKLLWLIIIFRTAEIRDFILWTHQNMAKTSWKPRQHWFGPLSPLQHGNVIYWFYVLLLRSALNASFATGLAQRLVLRDIYVPFLYGLEHSLLWWLDWMEGTANLSL